MLIFQPVLKIQQDLTAVKGQLGQLRNRSQSLVTTLPHPELSAMRIMIAVLAVSMLLPAGAAHAQADSGRVHVQVEESMGMVDGFMVRSAGRVTATDSNGEARLVLPAGPQSISISRPGFEPRSISVVVEADSIVTVRVTMTMTDMGMEMPEVKVTAARTDKLAGDTPIRVEVVDEMEVDEKTLMAPSGIGMLLNETPGIRVHHAAPGLGTGSVRILGLPGQYTVMLADGLPLYGGSASALGPLDISPVDLQRIEIIKGAASALYGGQSLGGVINLVSKPPTGRKELLLNRRMLGVSDAATWMSHRLGQGTGISLLAAGTLQDAKDIDDDGWADQPDAARWNVRPRLHYVGADGRSLFVTAGYGLDDRDGGTLGNGRAPDGSTFREALRSNRFDVGATGSIPRSNGSIAMRLAFSSQARQRHFGTGPREDDNRATGFVELTRSLGLSSSVTVLGAAVQLDRFDNRLNTSWNHNWVTPALFFTSERVFGTWTFSLSARGDAHPDAGLEFTERVAILNKLTEQWSVRASVGTGFAPATALTEETEAIGLRTIQPGATLRPERSIGAMLDINGRLAGAELLLTVYRSQLDDVIQLVDPTGPTGQVMLRNADSEARLGGVETIMLWRFPGGKFIGNYGYSRGTIPDAMTGVRVAMPMLTRHRIGGDLMMEKEGAYRWGIEGTWFGEQPLEHNPYRTRSKPYVYVMAIFARIMGSVELVANFENILDVKQTDSDPLVRPTAMRSGRWTTDVWAPLEGFMANVAVRYRWK
jgi:outer membrane receptor for ferrienterochelin and colicins